MRPSVLADAFTNALRRGVAVACGTAAIAVVLLASSAALAREPSLEKWTPVTPQVRPEHVVNYATMTLEEARGMLETHQAPLLYEAATGFDELPEEGLILRSRHRLITEEGFGVFQGEQGPSLWRIRGRRAREPMHEASNPIRRVLGLPVTGRVSWQRLGPYEPVLIELEDRLILLQHVDARIQDPYDPTRSTLWASLAASSTVPLVSILEGDRADWQLLLTVGGRRRDEPRVVLLPIDARGELDTSRDGVLVRFGVVQSRVDPTLRSMEGAVHPSAVRIHFGDRDSLQARYDAMPEPPRERYSEPGSDTDPLMIAPRTPRDPLGAGVEARSAMLGDLTLLAMRGNAPTNVVPRWGGVEVDAWLGRAWVGAIVRDDMIVGQGGVRVGRMRDTGATAVGLELGRHLDQGFVTHSPLAVNAVLTSVRVSPRRIFGQQIEMANNFRVGTIGFDYRSDIGLRTYVRSGLVVTPYASGGFRYAVREERALLLLGGGLEVTWNRNFFAP